MGLMARENLFPASKDLGQQGRASISSAGASCYYPIDSRPYDAAVSGDDAPLLMFWQSHDAQEPLKHQLRSDRA
jgi:hypothetical protein